MRALKIAGVLLLVLLLLATCFVAYITMTHGGMQRLFSLGSSYLQGELRWGELHGSLVGPADITGLQYTSDDGTSVTIDSIQFDWHPRSLLRGQLDVENFGATGIEVRLPKPAANTQSDGNEPFQLKDLSLPLGVRLRRITLSDIRIYANASKVPIVIDSVFIGGNGQQSEFQILEFNARAPIGTVKIDGVVNTSGSWPMSLAAVWAHEDARIGALQGHATASGNLDELVLNHELRGPLKSTADLTVANVIGEFSVTGDLLFSAANLGVFSPAVENMPLVVDAKISGNMQGLDVAADIASVHDATGPLTMTIDATMDSKVVQLKEIKLSPDESPGVISATGEIDLTAQQVDLDLQWADLAWPIQSGPVMFSDSSGELHLLAKADGVSISGDGVVLQEQTGRMDLTVDLAVDPQQIQVTSITVRSAGTDGSFDMSGSVSLADNRVDLGGGWQNLRWPLREGAADYQSDSGKFSVVGPLSEYQLSASADIGGAKIPAGRWVINGSGSERAISDLKVAGDTLDGNIDVTGSVTWSPQAAWDFAINARAVNPEAHWPGFDASVDIDVKSSGQVTATGLTQSTDILSIGGSYKGQPLDGAGGINIVDGNVVLDNLSLAAGPANLTATGIVGTKVDMHWHIDAPALEALIPGFKGELQVTGDHSGTRDSMGSQIVIDSAQIESEVLNIGDLDGIATVDPSGGKESEVKLQANDISLSGQTWDAFVFKASGTPQSHDIAVQLDGKQGGKLMLAAAGEYAEERWSGLVSELSALATVVGDWRLDQPVTVTAGKEEVKFRDLCLRNNASSLCAGLTRMADGSVDADVEMQEFDVAMFAEYLPADIAVNLKLEGQANLALDDQGEFKVTANIGFPDGGLQFPHKGSIGQRKLGKSEFTTSITNDTLIADVNIDLVDLGFVTLEGNVSGLAVDEQQGSAKPQVRGKFDSEIKDLSIVALMVPGLESVTGVLRANLAFVGALDSPRVTGAASVDELSLEVPSLALEAKDGSLNVSGNGRGGLLLRGEVHSGEGKLELDGSYSATSGAFNLGVVGQDFRVSNTLRQQVDVSPDLAVRFADRKLTITGDLLVPTALVKAGGGESVIHESPDVIIVDATAVRAEKKENDIDLDVLVTLGDNIRVEVGQFDGELAGVLAVKKKPGQVITGSGTIEVVNGDFLVYGQRLTMEQGRILFSGGPIDNPVLDLDVARDVTEDNVKAGVKITGNAQAPILELQSDPPQTDANTLSYILLGKPVDALGASYTLGRYITPDIYVSFGFDLFDKREIITLRYKLSEKLSLIGSSSRSRDPSSGADLIYTLER